MTHIMLDIETWGRTLGSDIRSIGAVVFDPVVGYVAIPCGDENNDAKSFYIATENPISAYKGFSNFDGISEHRKYPLTRDPETIQWWIEQSAQAAFANPVDLREALVRFDEWLSYVTNPCRCVDCGGTEPTHHTDCTFMNRKFGEGKYAPPQHVRLWANDPHFDVSILDACYRAVGLPVPWHYRAPRSQKTITDAAGMTRDDYKPFEYGTAHNALDDAISQAMIVCEAYKRLGL